MGFSYEICILVFVNWSRSEDRTIERVVHFKWPSPGPVSFVVNKKLFMFIYPVAHTYSFPFLFLTKKWDDINKIVSNVHKTKLLFLAGFSRFRFFVVLCEKRTRTLLNDDPIGRTVNRSIAMNSRLFIWNENESGWGRKDGEGHKFGVHTHTNNIFILTVRGFLILGGRIVFWTGFSTSVTTMSLISISIYDKHRAVCISDFNAFLSRLGCV